MPLYAGSDVSSFPGDALTDFFARPDPVPGMPPSAFDLTFSGAYLSHAPLGSDQGWIDAIAPLHAKGWGIAPIFLLGGTGAIQQTVMAFGTTAAAAQLAVTHGKWAIHLARDLAKLDQGSVIYIDLEGSEHLDNANVLAYIDTLIHTLVDYGYRPGLYAHAAGCNTLKLRFPDLFLWLTSLVIDGSGGRGTNPQVLAEIQRLVFTPVPGTNGTQLTVFKPDPSRREVYPALMRSTIIPLGIDWDAVLWQWVFLANPPDFGQGHVPWPEGTFDELPNTPVVKPIPPATRTNFFSRTQETTSDGRILQHYAPLGTGILNRDLNSAVTREPQFPERSVSPLHVRSGRAVLIGWHALLAPLVVAIRRGAFQSVAGLKGAGGNAFPIKTESVLVHPWCRPSVQRRGNTGFTSLFFLGRSTAASAPDRAWNVYELLSRKAVWLDPILVTPAPLPIDVRGGIAVCNRYPDSGATQAKSLDAFWVAWSDPGWKAEAKGLTFLIWAKTPPPVSSAGESFDPAAKVAPNFSPNPGSGAAAVCRQEPQVDVFAIGRNDLLPYSLHSPDVSRVDAPFRIGADNIFAHPASRIAALSRKKEAIDVFFIGAPTSILALGVDAATSLPAWSLQRIWWNDQQFWAHHNGTTWDKHTEALPNQTSLRQPFTPDPAARFEVVNSDADHLHVFAVRRQDARIHSTSWDANAPGWNPWTPVERAAGNNPAPLRVASIDGVIFNDLGNFFHLLFTGCDREAYFLVWPRGGPPAPATMLTGLALDAGAP